MNKYLTAGLIAAFALTACGGGAGGGQPGSNPPSVPNPAKLSTNVLQFAVGTANIATAGAPITGLNVVATYRQPKGQYAPGDTGALVDSPTLTLPGALPNVAGAAGAFSSTIQGTAATSSAPAGDGGPSTTEEGGHVMTSTSQNPGAANTTTFGTSGGVFGLGIEPYNYLEGDVPSSESPYMVPLYDNQKTAAGDPNAFEPWGGPPAFNPANNGASGDVGISLGLDVFESVAPAVGQYQLTVSVPANTGTVTQTASASIATATVLGPATAPVLTPDGSGGGTFAYVAPTGTSEGYIQVTDYGPAQPTSAQATAGDVPVNSCNGSSQGAPEYFTIPVTTSGTYTLPDGAYCTAAENAAAAVNPAPVAPATTIGVTGDQFTVQVIGFDYPAYEMSYPNSLGNPAPTINGANPTDDITISVAACNVEPAGSGPFGSCNAALPLNNLSIHRRTGSKSVRYR